jgi:hypothetical protein
MKTTGRRQRSSIGQVPDEGEKSVARDASIQGTGRSTTFPVNYIAPRVREAGVRGITHRSARQGKSERSKKTACLVDHLG